MRSIALVFASLVSRFASVNGLGAPNLNIPGSRNTVDVRIIDTTSSLGLPMDVFVEPHIKGMDEHFVPALSFLIEHDSGRKLLFDLGVRPDYKNLAPANYALIAGNNGNLTVQKGVAQILKDNGFNPNKLEAIIWSRKSPILVDQSQA